MTNRGAIIALLAGLVPLLCAGCNPPMYVPDQATRAYPDALHLTSMTEDGVTLEQPRTVDIQVFRDDTDLEIVNSTARTYRDFDLWINQRYVAHIDELPAGATRRISLWRFIDKWGQRFNAGGFWRTVEPTPVVLVEIQFDDQQPLVGLITIRTERD